MSLYFIEGLGISQRKRSTVICLVLIWLAALSIRLIFFTGYMNGDMGNYIQEAHNIFSGHYSVGELLQYKSLEELVPNTNLNWQNLRLGLILPVGFLMKIFGASDFSYALFTLSCFTLSYLLVYFFGKELVSESFGLLSALIFSFIPLEINLSTVFLPHLPSATFMALSCFLFLKGTKSSCRKNSFLLVCSGISVGVAYYIWEFSIVLTPVFFFYLLVTLGPQKVFLKRKFWSTFLLMASGFVPLMAAGIIYFYSISGVMFFQQKFISLTSPKWLKLHQIDLANLDNGIYLKSIMGSYYFGCFFYFAIGGILILVFKYFCGKNRSLEDRGSVMVLPLIWFLWLGLYLQFGTSSLSEYQPVFKMSHYLSAVSIPAALLAAYFVNSVSNSGLLTRLKVVTLTNVRIKTVMIIAYISLSVLCAYANFAGNGPFHRDMTNEHRLKDSIEAHQLSGPIYTDVWTKNGLDFVFGYERPVTPFNSIDRSIEKSRYFRPAGLSDIKDGYVVINNIYLTSKHTMNTDVPTFVSNIPNEWTLVERVFSNSGKQSIDIYKTN